MKYIIRIIVLPFWVMVYLIFTIYRVLKSLFALCFDFVVYGGEQITNSNKLNRNTIFEVYQKVEKMEAMNIDSKRNCNHIWKEEYGITTSIPTKKCVVCGFELINKTF